VSRPGRQAGIEMCESIERRRRGTQSTTFRVSFWEKYRAFSASSGGAGISRPDGRAYSLPAPTGLIRQMYKFQMHGLLLPLQTSVELNASPPAQIVINSHVGAERTD
jgi:hypothetical protein